VYCAPKFCRYLDFWNFPSPVFWIFGDEEFWRQNQEFKIQIALCPAATKQPSTNQASKQATTTTTTQQPQPETAGSSPSNLKHSSQGAPARHQSGGHRSTTPAFSQPEPATCL
jgi:hypothetical protein